ncbi:peptidoglycan recognition protein family protein [Clostridium sp. Cult3]|uniref:peptidoglycan recognition protein family protein n=1 Tax=Clostridium sp. Cult3 TaxID=2079004 RepID=UPI001F00AF11|nr:N-acetylmuramoyl-L-alanine amidase [Clostridium sp. Cult3]MCF6461509.1 N-acetylmuramoyl-L-alanine amidase [Clostridium sp. Cult3]
MNYKVQHIPVNKAKRPGKKIKTEYITIHSTANKRSTAQNERDWLVNPSNNRSASWHIVVDEIEAIEAIPLDEIAYHAGSTQGNSTSIGIEICESGNRQKTLQNAVKLVAKMLYERNWGVNKLRRHFDWSGKNCPRILSYNNWAGWIKFKQDVRKELDILKGVGKVANKKHWGEEYYNNLAKKGIKLTDKRYDDKITRAEAMALVDKATDRIIEMIKEDK